MREICQGCGEQEASIRFTEVSREGRSSLELCQRCAVERGAVLSAGDAEMADTRQIWKRVMLEFSQSQPDRSDSGLACPACRLEFADFERESRLGCPQCYQTFMGDMTRLLKDYHGDSLHRGKVPYDIGRRIDLRRKILNVKESIHLAVRDERFEEAARLRDEVRDLEIELRRLLNEDGAR
jgi:protein arginine kinase activator